MGPHPYITLEITIGLRTSTPLSPPPSKKTKEGQINTKIDESKKRYSLYCQGKDDGCFHSLLEQCCHAATHTVMGTHSGHWQCLPIECRV